MTKAANEDKLGGLHDKVATVMIRALDQIEQSQNHFEELAGTDKEPDLPPDINPALLSVMVRFLDSNKITCAPADGNTMSDLERKLAEKRKKRRSVGNVVHLEADE